MMKPLTNSVHICVFSMLAHLNLCSVMNYAFADPIQVPKVTISLVRESNIPSRDAGVIAEISVKEGDAVSAGQTLAILEDQQQRLDVKAAELNLRAATLQAENQLAVETATAQLKEAQASRKGKEAELRIAEQQARSEVSIKVAVADTKLRQLELERAESARKSFKGSVSETELDRLRTAVTKGELETIQAQDNRRIQQLKLKSEDAALTQIDEQVRRYQSVVRQEERKLQLASISEHVQKNELEIARLKLDQRSIRVPFDGVVVKVDGQVGEWVEPGASIARIIDLDTLQAEGFLPAAESGVELTGRPVEIRLNGSTESITVSGRVTFVSPEVDPVQNQVRFKAEFENVDRQLRPGMSGSLIIAE